MNKTYIQRKIKELFIVHENDGSYNLFGTYVIRPNVNGAYRISVINDNYQNPIEFSSLKYAVSWCVFEKNCKHNETKRLFELDHIINSLEVNIAQHKRLAAKAQESDKNIYLAKFLEDKLKKKKALEEIEQYTALSRHIQDKKYAETKVGK